MKILVNYITEIYDRPNLQGNLEDGTKKEEVATRRVLTSSSVSGKSCPGDEG
jgi:hypothetical protein